MMEIITLNPQEIKVKDNLPRYREDMKKIKELRDSIIKLGQLQPIIITKEKELVAGGRRLAACILNNMEIACIYKENLSDIQMREIEVEENIQREALSPSEEAAAITDLHAIKQELYGKSTSGREGGWTLEKTAETIGRTKGTVIDAIFINDVVNAFPELKDCKTKSEIKKAAYSINRTVEKLQKTGEYEEKVKISDRVHISCEDAFVHMKNMKDSSVDLLLTDPLYEINADDNKRGVGNVPGGLSTAGYKVEDPRTGLLLIQEIAKESIRFCKPTSHAYIFVAPEHFWTIRSMFITAGWDCYIKPFIWCKPNAGQTNLPLRWPSSSYEMILFCRREESKLKKLGQRDYLEWSVPVRGNKVHDFGKPVELLEKLIERTSYPGETLYDPCIGGGSSIVAGIRRKLFCYGCDISKESYVTALEQITEELKK